MRSAFGQFIGQDMPVDDSTQSPHIRQSNKAAFDAPLHAATGRSSRAKPIRAKQRRGGDEHRFERFVEALHQRRVADAP